MSTFIKKFQKTSQRYKRTYNLVSWFLKIIKTLSWRQYQYLAHHWCIVSGIINLCHSSENGKCKLQATHIKTFAHLQHSQGIVWCAFDWLIAKHCRYSNDLNMFLCKQHYDRLCIINPRITVNDDLMTWSWRHATLHITKTWKMTVYVSFAQLHLHIYGLLM